MLLPLSKRTFGGEVDLAGLEAGYYALRVMVDGVGSEAIRAQEIIKVGERRHGGDRAVHEGFPRGSPIRLSKPVNSRS